ACQDALCVGHPCPAGSFCAAGACVMGSDRDGDGVPNATDRCPDTFDPAQADSDGDGDGDACDCAPMDAARHARAAEQCANGVDDDCDGLADCADDACAPSCT